MQKEIGNWFTSWFDTPYYHILYKDRDCNEAGLFMKKLTAFLELSKGDKILDLACGRGRHSRRLNELSFDVTGVDLSPSSIGYAKQFESDKLHFDVHDMCLPYLTQFDAVFNLFTSFGYFEKEEDNFRTIKAIKEELKPNGFAVIDFLNTHYVKKNLVANEEKLVEGINFHIHRIVENGYIVKTISFSHNNKEHEYVERVKALTLKDFETYFDEAKVSLKHCFGDYQLNPFNEETSKRLILIFKK